ncbi:zinc metalloproteinase nas-4-like [Stegodyphus dumicola]|uniref:zinc metalloproteinase nas-4-like n=1 Tax=Stegodyphus dumicola TaxID=202533 RepID=UPI0015B0CB97|nr:zinc metalloproteinase nas-4-like [Stegodyphus dumicola]
MIEDYLDPWDRHGPIVDMKLKRWPAGRVPYKLNETAYNLYDKYTILEGLKEIEKYTCIKFVPRTNERDYIFVTPLGGCWSYIGHKGMEQTLSLVVPNCINKGTVIHEFMHALGFWHEHSRSDRDDYIEILWNNLSEEKQVNFAKRIPDSWSFIDFAYDYQSVMHYNAYTFSKAPKLPTMKPKSTSVRLKDLGRAKTVGTLTDSDKKKINKFYECNKE